MDRPQRLAPATAWNGTGYNDGTYEVAVWVGIDGWYGTTDVLQAGTTSAVTVSGGKVTGTSYFPWIEWFGNNWQPESDFTVSPGDSILCTVCAPFSNTHGTAMFTNLTTSTSANYGIEPPAGVSLIGNVAEWIVEDPGQLNKQLYPFPNYGQTTFQNCGAGTKDISLNMNNACPLNLINASNSVISEGIITGPTTLQCNFV